MAKTTIGTTGSIGAWVIHQGPNTESATSQELTPGFDAQGLPVIGTPYKAVTITINGNRLCTVSNPG